MKIGIIFCGFNTSATVEKSLEAWKEIRANPGENQFVYSCVSVPFLEYKDSEIPEDDTIEKIRAAKIMDFHITEPKFISEVEARGLCLEFIKSQNCELIFMVDLDEIFTTENIQKILEYVKNHPEIAMFKISYKNYVFDENTYLVKEFAPPRIYRTDFPPFKLSKFYEDNGISFLYGNQEVPHTVIPAKQIPRSKAWVKHLSWSNPEISRQKINYQRSRGWNCDFTYDETGKISFNSLAFKDGKFPETISEN